MKKHNGITNSILDLVGDTPLVRLNIKSLKRHLEILVLVLHLFASLKDMNSFSLLTQKLLKERLTCLGPWVQKYMSVRPM